MSQMGRQALKGRIRSITTWLEEHTSTDSPKVAGAQQLACDQHSYAPAPILVLRSAGLELRGKVQSSGEEEAHQGGRGIYAVRDDI